MKKYGLFLGLALFMFSLNAKVSLDNEINLTKSFETNQTKKFIDLEKKCAEQNGTACFKVGVHLFKGEGVTKDINTSYEFFHKACDLNATNVCTRLAMSYEDKEHARYNIKKSIELYEKACALNDIRACDGLGFLYTRSESFMKPNEALSLKYFMKTCELAPYTCEKIATAYETGNKLKKNIDNAIKFYEKACDNNLTQSCSKLGRIHLENQNYKTALPFLIKACESKEDWSCTQVAKVYENGNKEVLKDKEKSVLFYDKACDFGSRTSCKNLALKYLSEENPAKNMHKVLHYFVKACDKADADACREVALIYKSGKNGVKINKMRSLNFFSKACNYGNEKSCKLKQ